MGNSKRTYVVFSTLIFSVLISGCATMGLNPGMTIKNVDGEFYVFCTNGRMNDNHIVKIRNFELDQSIEVYKVNPAISLSPSRSSYPELCSKELFFKNGRLLSDEVVNDLKNSFASIERDMRSYIENNKLTVLKDFQNTPNSEFKIYSDNSGVKYYSINYKFVESSEVSQLISDYENKQKENELLEKRIQARLFEQQQAQMRHRIQQENERDRRITENRNNKNNTTNQSKVSSLSEQFLNYDKERRRIINSSFIFECPSTTTGYPIFMEIRRIFAVYQDRVTNIMFFHPDKSDLSTEKEWIKYDRKGELISWDMDKDTKHELNLRTGELYTKFEGRSNPIMQKCKRIRTN